jgi:ferredoxin-type protein NapH
MGTALRGREFARKSVQAASLLLSNLYLSGWVNGTIYTGRSKMFCIPGLHCYSCPSSVLACPVGSLQNLLASPGFAGGLATLRADALTVLAVVGFILAVGFAAGRIACGWVCPFGLIQELLYTIPLPKVKVPSGLRGAKYAVLVVFVVLLPLLFRPVPGGGGDPWFCKAICPEGTLTAGWPLAAADGGETFRLGFLFAWKSVLLVLVIVWAAVSKRPFCRVLCPLGAVWGLAGKVSLWRMHVTGQCTTCGRCREECPVDLDIWKDPSSAECIRCMRCIPECPAGCISHRIGGGDG